MTWWEYGFNTFMTLIYFTKPIGQSDWNVDGFRFKISDHDISRHHGEMCEQLWAIEQGLA